MDKRKNLISKLKLAITALQDGTIRYDWYCHESCNCGVVAQALLGKNRVEIEEMFKPVLRGMSEYKESHEDAVVNLTWKDGVSLFCPITGNSMYDIFNKLMEAGMSKADMAHLEYMDNPAILKRSGIETKEKYTKKEMVTKKIPNGFWRNLFNMPEKTHKVEEEVTKERVVDYYKSQEKLVRYLKAWVEILEDGSKYTNHENLAELSREDLEAELINVIAGEDYERAAEIRNELAVKE